MINTLVFDVSVVLRLVQGTSHTTVCGSSGQTRHLTRQVLEAEMGCTAGPILGEKVGILSAGAGLWDGLNETRVCERKVSC